MTADSDLLDDDNQARATALDVTRSFIVQAPAGSGKTELLIQRYLRLLAGVDSPEEIVAITFTNKAAAEMRARVLRALDQAETSAAPNVPHQRLTWMAARDVLQRDTALNWNLRRDPRRMRIQTMDSLTASIARMRPVTLAGTVSGNQVVANAQAKALYQDAALATLDYLPESDDTARAAATVLQHLDNKVSTYVRYLGDMLSRREQWLPFIGRGDSISPAQATRLRQKLERGIAILVEAQLQRTQDMLPITFQTELPVHLRYAASQIKHPGKGQHLILACAELDVWPDPAADRLAVWQAAAELMLTQDGRWRSRISKTEGFPPKDDGQKQAFSALLNSLRDDVSLQNQLHAVRQLPPARYTDQQWTVLLALLTLLPVAVAESRRLFSERSVTDYAEVAICAADALGSEDDPSDIVMLLDYELRHLLVDEMQDTSLAQYELLQRLTAGWTPGDGRTLFCVGDPMQSIYRFRNAEVAQFTIAQVTGIGSVPLQPLVLRRNFRSGERLVHWFNATFASVLPPRTDVLAGAVSYSQSVSVDSLSGFGSCAVHPVIGSDRLAEGAAGVRVIRELLAKHPGDKLAVLVRGRSHLTALLDELRAANIRYQAVEIDRLTDLPEIVDILALTRAMVHAGDRIAWLGVLRAPWIGLDWTDLHALVKNDRRSTVWELLHDEKRLLQLSAEGQQRVAEAKDNLGMLVEGRRVSTLRDAVERAWLCFAGPGILQDPNAIESIHRYLDVIGKFEVDGTLADVAALEDFLDDERISSAGDANVQIMTMHRAKGLEFDHVILTGLGRKPRGRDREVLNWMELPKHIVDDDDNDIRILSPVGRQDELDKDPLHQFMASSQRAKDVFETARLLYVACTRAKNSLHLIGHAVVDKDETALKAPDKNSLLHVLWPHVESTFKQTFATTAVQLQTNTPPGWLYPVLRRLDGGWNLPAVEDLPGVAAQSTATRQNEAVEYDWAGTSARWAGTIVHRWLQLASDSRLDLAQLEPATLGKTSARWLREMGVAADDMNDVQERVALALHGVMDDAKGRWLLSGEGFAELGLNGVVGGRVESVRIDRVRIDDDGTHWIVDYKTSTHEGGNLAAFLRAEADRYRAQLQRYKLLYSEWAQAPVRCALYFPLLREFVEVDV